MHYLCLFCNRAKGSDLGSLDPETGQLTPFFDPREQQWTDHFRLVEARIEPLTAEGRVTVAILQFNHPERLAERQQLIAAGLYNIDVTEGVLDSGRQAADRDVGMPGENL